MYSLLTERDIDPLNEILVTVGAHGALHDTFQGLVNPGDEVIIIEPFSNRYESMVRMADGVPVFVPLRLKKEVAGTSADWILDRQELASKFNPNTRMIILNTPHCPTGKVFSCEELDTIAKLCKKHNVICVVDETWEWVVFEDAKHVRMNTLPGMWERTLTIGSAGRTFGVTGWKIGWAYGPQPLLRGLRLVHQNCVALVSTVFQEAIAVALENVTKQIADPAGYLSALSASMQKKRDFMCRAMSSAGIPSTIPEAGHFIVCDFSSIASKVQLEGKEPKECMLETWLLKTKNLLVFPLSACYSADHRHLAGYRMRICFAKCDSVLEKAAAVLSQLAAVSS
ncbi:kynurenine aminotransferase-like isoform X2 [Amblyomma americanum]